MTIVNPLTTHILKSHLETYFNDYFDWRRLKGRKEQLLEIRAIEFPNDEAQFLGGAIVFQNKSYGMAYLQYQDGSKSIAELEAEQNERSSRFQNILHVPHQYLAEVCKYLDPHTLSPTSAATELYFDPVTERTFSGLDLRFDGSKEIDFHVVTRGKKHSRQQAQKNGKLGIRCSAFWTTKIAEERISSYVGEKVVKATIEKQMQFANSINEENRKIAFCKERPYKLFLLGTDDTSYTKTFETKDALFAFTNSLKLATSDYVTSHMTMTN